MLKDAIRKEVVYNGRNTAANIKIDILQIPYIEPKKKLLVQVEAGGRFDELRRCNRVLYKHPKVQHLAPL